LKTIGAARLFIENTQWNASALKEHDTPTTWVGLGAILRAYGVNFLAGDDLVISNRKACLPVHPTWILAIGLIG
jgi:hypothetical protein